jgi:fumarylpyruvate hydrolase
MEWDIASLISILSQQVTLKPGDVIFTGTPEGVGPLNKGDKVVAEIENVGSLNFKII